VLGNLKIDRSCLVAIEQQDDNLYKSARNIPKVSTTTISDLNAGDICNRQKMLFTKSALLALINGKQNEN
jgi:large subunit ribosomal protein L4